AKDIAHMTTDDNEVTADCQFCGAHYSFATFGLENACQPLRKLSWPIRAD
ncbi:Hsp33 family molecular chaperone HslO, partial [Planktomarina temperata]|nr:Hsp33 family molecular chaperone HslO [Planktomarina temperata]